MSTRRLDFGQGMSATLAPSARDGGGRDLDRAGLRSRA